MIRKMKNYFRKLKKNREYGGYIYILPWLIGTVLFFCYPVFKTFIFSCSKIINYAGLQTVWVGLDNYIQIFTTNINFIPDFVAVVRDTFINIPMIVIFALFIAILANKDIKMKGLFRGIFILPFLLGSGYVFKAVVGIDVNAGITTVKNQGILIPQPVLDYMGVNFAQIVQMFLDRISLIILRSPIQVIVFLGALQTIPLALYESAKCDGATEWEMFWKITLPMIIPQILFNTIFTLVESFTDLSNPVINSIMGAWFTDKNYVSTAAMGWIYLLFISLTALIIFFIWGKIGKKKEMV